MKLNKKDLEFWTKLEDKLKTFIDFKNLTDQQKYTLITAFTHKSYANEHKSSEHNDFLEFVGDGVLQFISTMWISKLKLTLKPRRSY
ncbi:ribonuclease III family protein [Metamycoplasma gateae]|uniref:RNase III domain-containing protein n=1 Tax=Metamycoplasma gateae TaxID=35769 RepID=A0ABZ2AGN2_9BACT|nr:hypothetical protein V2E26_02540 [Metamycoplasma gateae]